MANLSGFDSIPQAITAKAMAHNFNLEEKARREEAQLNKDFYFGKQEQTVTLASDDVEPIVMNLTKPIINKRTTMLYRRPLNREFKGNAASIAFLEKVYQENSIDTLLGRADLYSEITGSALLFPHFDENMDSGMRITMYDATQFSAVGADDDPATPDSISLVRIVDKLVGGQASWANGAQPQIERVMQQQVWTPEFVSLYDGSQEVSREPNELGFLPFVNFMGEEIPDQYIGYPPCTLVRKANHHINQLLTHLGFMIKFQAHTPIVLSGFKSGEQVVIHPGRALSIPEGASASTLSLDPKIADTLGTIQFLEDRLFTCSSVPRITVEGGEGESGRELLIRWWPLLQVFQEKTVRFSRYELQLANMCLAVAGMEPIEDVNILWPEESIMPLDPEADDLEKDIRLNIQTPIDEIQRRNPHLDETEAMAEFLANKDINDITRPVQVETDEPQEDKTEQTEEV